MWSRNIEKYHELSKWDFFANTQFRTFAEKCRTSSATDVDVNDLLESIDPSDDSIIFDIQRIFHDGIELYGGYLEVFCVKFMLHKFVPRSKTDDLYTISSLLVDQFNFYQYYQVGLGTSDKLEKNVIKFYTREFNQFPISSLLWNKHLAYRMSHKPEFEEWQQRRIHEREERKRKFPDSWKYSPFVPEDEDDDED